MKSVILFALIISSFAFTLPSQSQDEDCGNGLIQRLEVGIDGRIEPISGAQGVRVRQRPGQAEVFRLQPGQVFTVIGGPECFETHSWWEIEILDNGIQGWIAEGIEAGEYFVEPLMDTGPIIVDTTNCTRPSANFRIGQFLQLTTNPTADMVFYGHPLIDGAFFRLATYFQNNEYASAESYLPDLGSPDNLTANYLLVDGPVCINGHYMWQIKTDVIWLWIDEQYLRLSSEQPIAESIFIPQVVSLTEPGLPIISPELQIAYDGSAGGGGGGTLQIVNDGCQFDVGLGPSSYEYACIAVYPFPPSTSVDITISQADGTIIALWSMDTEPIELSIETGDLSSRAVLQTHGARVFVPTKLGVTSGVYVIEANGVTGNRQVAYLFKENYTSDAFADYNNEPVIITYCDVGEPILIGMNLNIEDTVELVFVEETQRTGNSGGTIDYREMYRWDILTGERGEFLATIDLELPDGYFVIADENGDWENNFPTFLSYFGDGAPLAESLTERRYTYCANNNVQIPDILFIDSIKDYILQLNRRYSDTLDGSAEWTFNGEEGRAVTINVESDEMDVYIVLQDSDGTILAEDDDSGQRTDARISGFVLPYTGEYVVIVRSWGDKAGNYTIILQR